MFYTEYRPQKFVELIGADHVVSALSGALAKGNASHAYFFTGSRGTGKTTTARLLAKSLNCENPQNGYEPCGECTHCKAVQAGRHLDLIEIDAASNRGIDNIRELKEGVGLSPSMGDKKIYIIDEVHMLTAEASNALLKTLEEPPEHAYFILCTTNPEKVLDTIKSRCQQFQFKKPTIDNLVSKLEKIAEDKNYKLKKETLKKLAVMAKGAYREAETLLEQIINGDGSQAIEDLLASESGYYDFLKMILSGETISAINYVGKIYQDGNNLEVWTEGLVIYIRALLLKQLGVKFVDDEYVFTKPELEFMRSVNPEQLKILVREFSAALPEFKNTVVPTLPLEMKIIDQANLSTTNYNIDDDEPDLESEPEPEPEPQAKPMPKPESKLKMEPKPDQPFPYKKLIELIKPKNHSIHLLLHSCRLVGFDGKMLKLNANYSFHKERLMSMKIKRIVEDVATDLIGRQVKIVCELSSKDPKSKSLTDRNVTKPKGPQDLEEVFEEVFGDELEA